MGNNNVTKPGSVRDRRREARREEILNAARELFVTLGPERTTMRRIADRLGQTTGALYAQFRDKESILRELCVHDFLALREAFQAGEAVSDPVERLRVIGRGYTGFALTHPNHYRLMFLAPHPPGVEQDAKDLMHGNPDQDAYAYLLHCVRRAVEAGAFRPEYDDPDLVAQVLWGALHGVIALELTHADDAWIDWRPVALRCQTVNDAVLRGLLRDA
jgi:AcrR family transcriptional regulator